MSKLKFNQQHALRQFAFDYVKLSCSDVHGNNQTSSFRSYIGIRIEIIVLIITIEESESIETIRFLHLGFIY